MLCWNVNTLQIRAPRSLFVKIIEKPDKVQTKRLQDFSYSWRVSMGTEPLSDFTQTERFFLNHHPLISEHLIKPLWKKNADAPVSPFLNDLLFLSHSNQSPCVLMSSVKISSIHTLAGSVEETQKKGRRWDSPQVSGSNKPAVQR